MLDVCRLSRIASGIAWAALATIVPRMSEPAIRSEGNLRFAGEPCLGYPVAAEQQARRVREQLVGQPGVSDYGPATILFTLPPHGDPATWEGQVGVAITGLPQPVGHIRIEDYHDLRACWIAHAGPIRELATTHTRLVERARTQGSIVRPYWRVQLWQRRLADGSPMPVCEVSVFLERF